MSRANAVHALALLPLLAATTPGVASAQSICPSNPEGGTMTREITTRVEIDAPAQRVWDILVDFERHPEWNPFIEEISGEARQGSRLSLTVRPPGGRAMSFEPTVLAAEEPRELRWLGKVGLPRIFDGEHRFVLEPLGAERVRLVHAERFRGILVPLLWRSLEARTREGFEQMNRALKERAENSVSMAAPH
jgi:hypothetical protein